jgi:hypothetical protein
MGLFGPAKACQDCSTAKELAARAERKVSDLELAFAEVQDKVYRWMQRTNIRAAREAAESNGTDVPGEVGLRGTGNNLNPYPAGSVASSVWQRRHGRKANGVPAPVPDAG